MMKAALLLALVATAFVAVVDANSAKQTRAWTYAGEMPLDHSLGRCWGACGGRGLVGLPPRRRELAAHAMPAVRPVPCRRRCRCRGRSHPDQPLLAGRGWCQRPAWAWERPGGGGGEEELLERPARRSPTALPDLPLTRAGADIATNAGRTMLARDHNVKVGAGAGTS